MAKEKKKLIPPDLEQCQAEMPNGHSFMTLGGVPGLVRCTAKPKVIAKELCPCDDGQHGEMSLCASCMEVMRKQLGEHFATFRRIDKVSKPAFSSKLEIGRGLSIDTLADLIEDKEARGIYLTGRVLTTRRSIVFETK